ncbi:hypothetical protein VTH82DRAFT_4984 [Thermothelomyces myriococcoides]
MSWRRYIIRTYVHIHQLPFWSFLRGPAAFRSPRCRCDDKTTTHFIPAIQQQHYTTFAFDGVPSAGLLPPSNLAVQKRGNAKGCLGLAESGMWCYKDVIAHVESQKKMDHERMLGNLLPVEMDGPLPGSTPEVAVCIELPSSA